MKTKIEQGCTQIHSGVAWLGLIGCEKKNEKIRGRNMEGKVYEEQKYKTKGGNKRRSKTLKSLLTMALFFSAIMIFMPIVSVAEILRA